MLEAVIQGPWEGVAGDQLQTLPALRAGDGEGLLQAGDQPMQRPWGRRKWGKFEDLKCG